LERGEERSVDLLRTIYPQPINTVIRHQARDPVLPHTQHPRVLSAEIREGDRVVALPAVRDAGSIVIINQTEGMIVGFLNPSAQSRSRQGETNRVKGVEDAVVHTRAAPKISHMVRHHIDHQVHASLMQRIRECDQIRGGSKVTVHLVDILRPIPMVRLPVRTIAREILHNGGDPDLYSRISPGFGVLKRLLLLTAVKPIPWI
jgi:hypothetical protein